MNSNIKLDLNKISIYKNIRYYENRPFRPDLNDKRTIGEVIKDLKRKAEV